MAIPRLVLKTDISALRPVTYEGQPVSAAYDRIAAFLRGQSLQLFAEPVESGTNRSWYGEGSGEPVPMADLPLTSKAAAGTLLTRALEALDPLLDDREMGPLLRRALVVPSLQSVLTLDDAVVLTEWGFAPADLSEDPAALASHVRSIFGDYSARLAAITEDFFREVPSGSRPVGSSAVGAPAPARVPVASAAAGAAAGRTAAAVAMPLALPATGAGRGRQSFWLVPLFAAVAALFLILGFWLAWSHFVKDLSSRQFQASLGDEKSAQLAIQTQRDTNAALERELANARRLLESANVCSPDFPNGGPGGGVAPLPERQPINPSTVPTPAPQKKGEAPTPFNGSLASLLEHATAWIVVQTPKGITSGTGFFVNTDTIVTNAHVVQDAADGRVYVTSKAMGRVFRGQVAAITRGADGGHVAVGGQDFAVVRLSELVPGAQPLAFSEKVEKLTDVVAAGYPSAIIKQEEAVRELAQGHLTGAPELVLTRGSISSMQQLPNGLTIIPHSADISAGNSGGPLVDLCGAVLGINTFVTAADRYVDRTKYALRSDAIMQWLTQQGVSFQQRPGDCRPAAASAPAPGPSAAADPSGAVPGSAKPQAGPTAK
ncbi:S1 family peptidase [Reyranella sp.]|uniref:S1 family peptidase n=1 Tax=Reyranella sp. TaxID=1929291 RepID=UPI003D117F2C